MTVLVSIMSLGVRMGFNDQEMVALIGGGVNAVFAKIAPGIGTGGYRSLVYCH